MRSRSDSPVLRVAVTSLASGVATALLPPARLPARVRRSLHTALGLGAGGAVLVALSRPPTSVGADRPNGDVLPDAPPGLDAEHSGSPLPVPARVALATAFGGLMALASMVGGVLDACVEQALVRRGLRHPRLWMGVAATALFAGASLSEKRLAPGPKAASGATSGAAGPAARQAPAAPGRRAEVRRRPEAARSAAPPGAPH